METIWQILRGDPFAPDNAIIKALFEADKSDVKYLPASSRAELSKLVIAPSNLAFSSLSVSTAGQLFF